MEADWEFEIGEDAPVIEAHWPGFVDLRPEPERATLIDETQGQPGLAAALARLNAKNSAFWTSKCDLFQPDQIDPDELEAEGAETDLLVACYIDMLLRSDQVWNFPFKAGGDCKQLCARLRCIPLRRCRVDLVIRRAFVQDVEVFGATAYFTACGRAEQEARERLAECLTAFAEVVVPVPGKQCENRAGSRK